MTNIKVLKHYSEAWGRQDSFRVAYFIIWTFHFSSKHKGVVIHTAAEEIGVGHSHYTDEYCSTLEEYHTLEKCIVFPC